MLIVLSVCYAWGSSRLSGLIDLNVGIIMQCQEVMVTGIVIDAGAITVYCRKHEVFDCGYNAGLRRP